MAMLEGGWDFGMEECDNSRGYKGTQSAFADTGRSVIAVIGAVVAHIGG